MILYEIVNPSDPYTLEASSLDVAATTSVLLGQGQYGLNALDGSQNVPMFVFGGADEWCRKHFNESLMEMSNRVMDTKLAEVADCLDSVLYGDEQDRQDFLTETADMNKETFALTRAVRQDHASSSLNDIGMRAYRMAAKLRESIKEGMKTLQ